MNKFVFASLVVMCVVIVGLCIKAWTNPDPCPYEGDALIEECNERVTNKIRVYFKNNKTYVTSSDCWCGE